MYRPISGLAQTDAASIRATVLPVPDSPPHRCTKNGREPQGLTKGEAKLAANTMRAITFPWRRERTKSSHAWRLPVLLMLSKIERKFKSPSKTRPST